MLGYGRRWRDREEGTLMCFSVADQARNIVVLQQCIGEYLGRGKARRSSDGCIIKARTVCILQISD